MKKKIVQETPDPMWERETNKLYCTVPETKSSLLELNVAMEVVVVDRGGKKSSFLPIKVACRQSTK